MISAVPAALWLPFIGALGLAIGSFLNVVIHRVPAGLSVVSPASACPGCGSAIRERDNIPVLSWVLLRGKCRDCSAPISVRYPAVEVATGVLFVVVALAAPSVPMLIAFLAVTGAGVALTLIDLEHQRLPLPITGVAACFAVPAVLVEWVRVASADGMGAATLWSAAWPSLAGCGIWVGLFFLLWFGSAGRAMGFGDVVLAPLLGLVLGAVSLGSALAGLAVAFMLGAVVGGVVMLLTRGPADGSAAHTEATHDSELDEADEEEPDLVPVDAGSARRRGTAVPFGPFMLVGWLVAALVGPWLAEFYMRAIWGA